jgi:hypothetical protein
MGLYLAILTAAGALIRSLTRDRRSLLQSEQSLAGRIGSI